MSTAAVLRTATDEELALLERALRRVVAKASAPSPAERERRKREHEKQLDAWAAKFLAAQQPWYEGLLAEVEEKLAQHFGAASKAGVEDLVEALLFSSDEAYGLLAESLRPLYRDAYEQAARVAFGSVSTDPFALVNERALEALAKRDVPMKTVAADAQERLRESIAEGIRNGETQGDLIARAREWAATGREGYAENVARTETASALNEGAKEGYREAGCTVKTWLSIVDENSRPDHADLDGETIPWEENFRLDSGEYDGPHDPAMGAEDACQCRCILVGGFEGV